MPLNYTKLSVIPDGNCLFRSLSWIRFGTQVEHLKIRQTLCQFGRNHPETLTFSGVPEESVGKYYDLMEKSGEWGDENMIFLAATYYLKTIIIFNDSGEVNWLQYSGPQMNPGIEVGNYVKLNEHFDEFIVLHYDKVASHYSPIVSLKIE